MYSKKAIIKNRTGLHARPASDFVSAAGRFKNTKITIKRAGEDDEANAKSIVMLLSLGLAQGEEIELTAKGEEEVEAVDALVELIESGFGED